MTPKPDLDAIERLLADCDRATALITALLGPMPMEPVDSLVTACRALLAEVREDLADRWAVGDLDVATTVPDETLRARLLALTADETPVDLCYHPDADPGNGAGWSLMVGDRTTYGTLDTLLPSPPPPENAHTAPAGGSSSLGDT